MIKRNYLWEHLLFLFDNQYHQKLEVEINAHLMIMLCIEYDKLNYIPHFPTRIDTAKKSLQLEIEKHHLQHDRMINEQLNQILKLKFYEI